MSQHLVRFAKLKLDTKPPAIAYKQFYLRVAINSQQENVYVERLKPLGTSYFGWHEKQSSIMMKSGQTPGLQTGVAMKTNEETYNPRITQFHCDGKIWWGFTIDDVNLQEGEIDIPDDDLPVAHFKFYGDSDVPAPPPKCMDIAIASYWLMILPSKPKIPKRTWVHKLLHFFKKFKIRLTGNSHNTTSYLNFSQMVTLEADLSNCRAKVKVKSGATGPINVD